MWDELEDAFEWWVRHGEPGVERRTGQLVWIECNAVGQWGFLPDSDAIADAFAAVLQAG
ncbi:hypothetical protein ACFOY4_30650 [Actinomadura syzygii]|uniref:hypothetical protein n=1 Tax=Actinomadura syzygii TaxID=1427538 RepID=UPI001CA30D26|nr:hypothetical protein [Actinomadura syzygii]